MEDYPGWAGGRLESGSFGDEPDGVRFLNLPPETRVYWDLSPFPFIP